MDPNSTILQKFLGEARPTATHYKSQTIATRRRYKAFNRFFETYYLKKQQNSIHSSQFRYLRENGRCSNTIQFFSCKKSAVIDW